MNQLSMQFKETVHFIYIFKESLKGVFTKKRCKSRVGENGEKRYQPFSPYRRSK